MENEAVTIERIATVSEQVMEALESTVVGQKKNIRLLWASFLIGGHTLLEGVPGLGKTMMVRALSQVVDASFARVQFTPDLMPADMTGTKVFDLRSGQFTFKKGPIFVNLLLADEINRTPPKTQAALLEAMEEKQVTIDGESMPLPSPFFVVATQNPIEYEGTYPLPEAQLDRFAVKLIVDYPEEDQEVAILHEHLITKGREEKLVPLVNAEEILSFRKEIEKITVEESVVRYLAKIIRSTRNHPRVMLGASPRAGLGLLSLSRALAAMNGRSFVTPDDIKFATQPALRHRIAISPDVELEGLKTDDVIEEIVQRIEIPR